MPIIPQAPPAPSFSALNLGQQQAQRSSLIADDFLDKIKGIFAVGLGGGLAVRGAQGLYNTTRRNLVGPKEAPTAPVMVVPSGNEEEKRAGVGDWLHHVIQNAPLAGDAHSVIQHPYFAPAALTAGAVGGYGGWKLTDMVLDSQRRGELKDELGDAQGKFEQALQPPLAPQGSPLGHDLDRLYADHKQQRKAASLLGAAGTAAQDAIGGPGVPGEVLGGAATGWPIIGLASAAITYSMLKSRQKQQVLQSALRKQHQQRLLTSPAYAVPEDIVSGEPFKQSPTQPRMPSEAAA